MVDAYAVFEGGGVKGSALVGALARAEEEDIKFRGVAGASAGAIVASLAAVGYNAQQLKQRMDEVVYEDFLDGRDRLPLAALRGYQKDLEALVPKLIPALGELRALEGRKAVVRYWKLRGLSKKYHQEIEQVKAIARAFDGLVANKGFYGTGTFLNWIRGLLSARGDTDQHGQVTFGSIAKLDPATLQPAGTILKIVATDLGKRGPRVYEPLETAGIEVAVAVQASMSIPIFFQPFAEGQSYLVDGGLLSNFPAWTFDREKARPNGDLPVLGFRLAPVKLPSPPLAAFDMYARTLLRTALEGTDTLQTRNVSRLVLINIRTPPDIPATKFDLTAAEREALYKAGYDQADIALSRPENRAILGLPPE